jgi:hypothetical protein
MKTNVFYILMTIIVMGVVIPAFAGSPDKKPGDNTKISNLPTSQLSPLTTWNLYIVPTDPNDTCSSYKFCHLAFHIVSATSDCEGTMTDPPPFDELITWGNRSYGPYQISTDVPCVEISIIDKDSPPCTSQISTHTCCTCNHNGSGTCYIQMCP